MRLDQVTLGFIQSGLENLKEQTLHNLSGKPLPMLDTPHSQNAFPDTQFEHL